MKKISRWCYLLLVLAAQSLCSCMTDVNSNITFLKKETISIDGYDSDKFYYYPKIENGKIIIIKINIQLVNDEFCHKYNTNILRLLSYKPTAVECRSLSNGIDRYIVGNRWKHSLGRWSNDIGASKGCVILNDLAVIDIYSGKKHQFIKQENHITYHGYATYSAQNDLMYLFNKKKGVIESIDRQNNLVTIYEFGKPFLSENSVSTMRLTDNGRLVMLLKKHYRGPDSLFLIVVDVYRNRLIVRKKLENSCISNNEIIDTNKDVILILYRNVTKQEVVAFQLHLN